MTTSDARKRRRDKPGNITISREGLSEVAQYHRNAATEFRSLAMRHDEQAAYIEGLIDGSVTVP
jgi:hypothetical protein